MTEHEETTETTETPAAPTPRRWLSRRMFRRVALVLGCVLLGVILLAVAAQQTGLVDRYVERSIKARLLQFGVKIEMGSFGTSFGPRFELKDTKLYDLQTGEQLGKIGRVRGRIRFSDLLAFRLSRKMDLEELEVDGLEVWVKFDQDGNSNFRYIHEGPPTPRLTFDFSAGKINVKNSRIVYGDQRFDISANGNNFAAQVQPVDRSLPPAERTFNINISSEGANFAYNDKKVENISLRAKAKVSRQRADIEELVLRSPFSESRLHGAVDDLQKLTYRLELDSSVDLQQAAAIFQPGAALRGNGNLNGTVTGEGAKYRVDAGFKADALAADQIYLKGLGVTAKGGGENQTYDIAGKAVAEMLTAGDFQMDELQLAGQLMGTGTDFRWLGELRSAAARYGKQADVSDLIINDVRAEMKDKQFAARVGETRAARIRAEQAQLEGFRANGVSVVRTLSGAIQATIDGANVAIVNAQGAKVRGVRANGITVTNNGGKTGVLTQRVTADGLDRPDAQAKNINADAVAVTNDGADTKITTGRVTVGGVNAQGAVVGSINVAGARLTVRGGRVAGESGEVTVSDVKLPSNKDLPGGGRLEDIRAARPVFTLEPSGRYRASMDLSLGGGVLGSIKLGRANAAVTATDTEVQAQNFTAEILNGNAKGNATINLAGGASKVNTTFEGLDVGGLLAGLSGQVAPLLAGKANGKADLAFNGTDVRNASGAAEAKFTGETGKAGSRLPLNGDLLVRAERGNFTLQRAEFRTPASAINASGQISLAKNTGDLTVGLSSTNAQELQALALTSGLLPPEVQSQADTYAERYALGGELAFNGTVRGNLSKPTIEGRASVGSLLAEGQNVGSVAATLRVAPDEIRVTEGVLRDPEGGVIAFNVNAPQPAANNIAVEATLNDADAANLARLAPFDLAFRANAKFSGRVSVNGLPQNMSGQAEINSGAGLVQGAEYAQNFDSLALRATFTGKQINLERVEAGLPFGSVAATGQVDLTSLDKPGLQLRAQSHNLSLAGLVKAFAKPNEKPPDIAGDAAVDIALKIPNLAAQDFSAAEITVNGSAPAVTLNGLSTGGLTLAGRTENKQFNLNLATGILGPPQTIAARLDLTNPNLPFVAETNLNNADLAPLIAIFLPDAAQVGAGARATGALRLQGSVYEKDDDSGDQILSLAKTSGTANFSAFTLQAQDIQMNGVAPVIVNFGLNEIAFERAQFTGAGTFLNVGGTLARNEAGRQNLSLDGKFNLRLLNPFIPDTFFNGLAETNVRVTGSYAAPRINGSAAVANGSFSRLIGNERLTLTSVRAQILFNQSQAEISRVEGILGGGRVTAQGGVALDGLTPARYRLDVRGNNVTVPLPEGFRSTVDGQVELSGFRDKDGFNKSLVQGRLNVKRAEYTQDIDIATFLARRPETSLASTQDDATAFEENTQLDLRLEGRDALVVRNNQIDALGSLSVRITGAVAEPVYSGRVTASRASLDFLGQRYELTRGYVDLPGRANAEPELNVQAESNINAYRVTARAIGPISQLRVELQSDPALPQADIVALLTTGRLDPGFTGGSALARSEVGSAATVAAEALVNAPVRKATDKLFGLNRFEIDPRISDRGVANPTARLTLGKQINRNLSITYSTNLASDQNQVVAVEYRLSNRLSFIAQYEQAPVTGFSSKNDIFSFEVRLKKKF
jgi:translocation and assembly module TamB